MKLPRAIPGLLALIAAPAWGQGYEISWWTVDGGGAMGAAGGSYALGATSGQADAGGPFAAGSYLLHSGFWAIAAGGGIGPQADLFVTKDDGQASVVPGLPLTYTIAVNSDGPDDVSGATVLDTPPALLTGVTWTCTATAGSSCPPSGSGSINAAVNLISGGSATFLLSGTVAPAATGTLDNTVSVTAPGGVIDPDPADNAATDSNTLTPQADLALALADAPDPVGQGGALGYALQVTNLGPSDSPGMTLVGALPPEAGFVASTPGAPECVHAAGTVTCTLPTLAAAGTASVSIDAVVDPAALGTISASASVTGDAPDPVTANDADAEDTQVVLDAEGELGHGTTLGADLRGVGPFADQDLYRLRQRPHASYEALLDAASGDIGSGSTLDRLASDGQTVLQSSVPAGAGASRSLRFVNSADTPVDDQYLRVRSAGCASDCDPEDVYRLRLLETTASLARWNNSASQITVVILQNRGTEPVSGEIAFWAGNGTLLHVAPFALASQGIFSLNTASVAALLGASGSISVAHDGRFGILSGKAVAVEPATGFTFDTELRARPR